MCACGTFFLEFFFEVLQVSVVGMENLDKDEEIMKFWPQCVVGQVPLV